ncbi:MAG: hypothetical protein HY072_03575 [Deltaproteobacteria bacterium]|nr:hypothetical protein [Deltaproteobacteria bacterium]
MPSILQSADPKIHVCCGRITNEESGCCAIGLGADIHEHVAEEKALHEVCFLHKHWNPKENTSMLLATHWGAKVVDQPVSQAGLPP